MIQNETKLSGYKVKLKEGTVTCKPGMTLYCPSHGPGKVVSVETKECLGEKITFCNLDFDKDDLKLSIPLEKMKEMGVRTIISKEGVKHILDGVLNKPAKSAKGIWTKRIMDYEEKLYSGITSLIAEVVRDLFVGMKDPNKSYGERVLYDKAFDRLVSEMAIALNVTAEEANKTILDVLNSNYKAYHDSEISISKTEDDTDEDDFDDDDKIVNEDDDDEEEKKAPKKSKKIA